MKTMHRISPLLFACCALRGQFLPPAPTFAISVAGVTATSAILSYNPPSSAACTIAVYDMNRQVSITSTSVSGSGPYVVTVNTPAAHGLLAGQQIYIENSGVTAWNGSQAIASVPSSTSFTFSSAATGSASSGNVGVLVEDVDPTLFASASTDTSRPSTLPDLNGQRTIVVGVPGQAPVALDSNRHSRTLQNNSRHIAPINCGSGYAQTVQFTTVNPPLGNTYTKPIPADRANPGSVSYPSLNWNNQGQRVVDQDGFLYQRVTGPTGAAVATNAAFAVANDIASAWSGVSGLLSSGTATLTGPCAGGVGKCPLFIGVGSGLVLGNSQGGYALNGSSLDWLTFTTNAAMSGTCSGNDCMVAACLTANSVSCNSAEQDVSLTSTSSPITIGSGALMDLWQGTGVWTPGVNNIDASTQTGYVNTDSTGTIVTLDSGSPFNIKWGAGSTITVNGSLKTIASVQHERQVTLTSSAGANLSGVVYSANNFGVLIWKKTNSTNTLSISAPSGHTAPMYSVGATDSPGWPADSGITASTISTTSGGNAGNLAFIGYDLYWVSSDNTSLVDLGSPTIPYYPPYYLTALQNCGSPAVPAPPGGYYNVFDPAQANTWYCTVVFTDSSLPGTPYHGAVKAVYTPPYAPVANGTQIPLCNGSTVVQSCVTYTPLNWQDTTSFEGTGPAFNPNYATSGWKSFMASVGRTADGYVFCGISDTGEMLITELPGQDLMGAFFVYTLGDRTPTGTDANSFRIIAARPSISPTGVDGFQGIHHVYPPANGMAMYNSEPFPMTVTQTSATLNTTPNVAGGLYTCPTNTFGVSGQVCTPMTISGDPTWAGGTGTGTTITQLTTGNILEPNDGFELLRIISQTDAHTFVVQRGYAIGGNGGTYSGPANHSTSTLNVFVTDLNANGAGETLWNYLADPYGTNANGSTVIVSQSSVNAHNFVGPYRRVFAEYTILQGNMYQSSIATPVTAPQWPPFYGLSITNSNNSFGSHDGPCYGFICLDAIPWVGYNGESGVAGTSTNPFTQVSGQLWKLAAAYNGTHRKTVPTYAYVGRNVLVDVSGPGSTIGTTSSDSFKYCIPNAANECVSGSAVGDVYVNAPYVSYGWAAFGVNGLGYASQYDDYQRIAIGDMGAQANGGRQFLSLGDPGNTGAYYRSIGGGLVRPNQAYVYWNYGATPSMLSVQQLCRWCDGIRTDLLLETLPSIPLADGVTRNTFIPVTVNLTAPTGLSVASAAIEFGYLENGNDFYCTSRQEGCFSVGSTIDPTTPFYFETTDTYSLASCAISCTIEIPALSGRMLYHRNKFFDGSGHLVYTGPTQVTATK